MAGETTLLLKIQNRNKMLLENPKNTYYCYSIWQESSDKIKPIELDTKFIRAPNGSSIIKTNSWLVIDDLAEAIEE